jgi:hypothetical protein
MMSKQTWIGLIMVGVGLLVLAANMGAISGLWVLGAIAAGFLGVYGLGNRHLGFLIPGLLVGGLAAFASLESLTGTLSGAYLFFFFAAAFYLVFALHTGRLNTEDRGERIWPLFPGTALLAVGLLVLGIEGNYLQDASLSWINMILPVGLIGVGLTLFIRNIRSGSSR